MTARKWIWEWLRLTIGKYALDPLANTLDLYIFPEDQVRVVDKIARESERPKEGVVMASHYLIAKVCEQDKSGITVEIDGLTMSGKNLGDWTVKVSRRTDGDDT